MPTQEQLERGPTIVSRYLKDIRQIRRLSREEEARVVRGAREGRAEAVNRLVESNLGFVVQVANPYRSLGLPFEDLLNEGNLGLIEAARRYDASKGTKFITYAVWWIRKAILRALAEKVQLVRVPHNQQRKLRELRDAESRLRRALGRTPTVDEVRSRVELSPAEIHRLRQTSVGQTSIDRPPAEGKAPVSEFLEDIGISSEQQIIERETTTRLGEALLKLNRQQRSVIFLRFGFGTDRSLTLQEVGDVIGLSRERVRQIEKQARERLRELLRP